MPWPRASITGMDLAEAADVLRILRNQHKALVLVQGRGGHGVDQHGARVSQRGEAGSQVDGGPVNVAQAGEDPSPHHGHPRLRKDLVPGEGLGQSQRNFGARGRCLGDVKDFVAHRLHQPAAAHGDDLRALVFEPLHQLGEGLFVHPPGKARIGHQVGETHGPGQGKRGVVLVAFAAFLAGLQSGLGPDGKPLHRRR